MNFAAGFGRHSGRATPSRRATPKPAQHNGNRQSVHLSTAKSRPDEAGHLSFTSSAPSLSLSGILSGRERKRGYKLPGPGGRKGGRPKSLTQKKAQMAQALYMDKNNTIDEICKTLNVSRATFYRYVKTK